MYFFILVQKWGNRRRWTNPLTDAFQVTNLQCLTAKRFDGKNPYPGGVIENGFQGRLYRRHQKTFWLSLDEG